MRAVGASSSGRRDEPEEAVAAVRAWRPRRVGGGRPFGVQRDQIASGVAAEGLGGAAQICGGGKAFGEAGRTAVVGAVANRPSGTREQLLAALHERKSDVGAQQGKTQDRVGAGGRFGT